MGAEAWKRAGVDESEGRIKKIVLDAGYASLT